LLLCDCYWYLLPYEGIDKIVYSFYFVQKSVDLVLLK